MRVRPDPLSESPVVRMIAMDNRHEIDIFEGDTLGYWCSECKNADESRSQIVHDKDCQLAGRHGRSIYGAGLDPINGSVSGEFRPDTTFTLLEWGESDPTVGIYSGAKIAFRCDECSNLDETLFEILHDEVCSLASEQKVKQHS
jgi:hypothetical protein